MPRIAKIEPLFDRSRGRWYVYLPAKLSATGKPQREYFPTKEEAETRSKFWHKTQEFSARAVRAAGPELIGTALSFDELFRSVYGLAGGLKEACERYIKLLDSQQHSAVFGDLVEAYEKDHYDQWADGTQSAWRAHRTHFRELEGQALVSMTPDFWRDWLREKSTERQWDNRTYNGIRSRLFSIYRHSIPSLTASNPIDGLKRRRVQPKAVAVYSIAQIQALLTCAWNHDRELVPFFAVAIFAGLRPESELERLEWKDVNLEERWIRVGANFDNKTQTRRFVPIEPNLAAWLDPWKSASGRVVPETNLTKRRRWITRGKYLAAPNTPESQWTEVAPYGDDVRDITRHTYGSYMDAIYRDRNKLKEWMGHSSFKTYDQHYRNARSEEDGKAFQNIFPPSGNEAQAAFS